LPVPLLPATITRFDAKFATLPLMATPGKLARDSREEKKPASESGRYSGARAAPAVITSRDNRWLKEFRVALRGGLPTESGFVGVEGVRLVEEALRSLCPVEAVLFSATGERHHERLAPLIDPREIAFPVLRTTDRLFEGIADTEHPQGVAALVKPRTATLDDLLQARGEACAPLLVVLAGVQDPGNVGTIIRTAAAFGATGAVTAASGHSGTASPFSPKALRASAGAALHLPILAGMSLPILLTQLRINNVRTLATSAHDAASAPVGAEHAPPLLGNQPGSDRGVVGARFPALSEAEGSASQSLAPAFRRLEMPAQRAAPLQGDAGARDKAATSRPVAPWEINWCQPVALLVGNEGAGLPQEIERSADARIHIPIASGVESLNAAAAAAVLFYEAARQRAKLTNPLEDRAE
jgi:RNA methyltransferase, TrmH family